MSHVDEGALHAYLDGALDEYPPAEARGVREHLKDCAECAERLEEERRIRQDASAILGLATPDVDVPSFEELKAYVQATRPTVGRPTLRLYRLGWAASVILALGVGWMARGGLLDEAMGPESSGVQVRSVFSDRDAGRTSPVTTAASEGVEAGVRPGAEDAGDIPTASGVGTPERQFQGETVAGGAAGDRDQLSKAEDERAVVPEVEALERANTIDNVASASPPGAAVPTDAPEEPVVAGDRENLDDSLADREALPRAGDLGGLVAALPSEELRVRGDSTAVTASPLVASSEPAREADTARRRAAEPVTARIDAAAVAPPRDLPAFAQAPAPRVDMPDVGSVAVPGVDVLSYANLEEGTAPKGLHVVQVFENGDTLDVYHLPEGVEPSVLPPVETGRNEVSARREGGWVVLRAPRSVETLRELLARIVPEG
jgi:hypothetical protein